MFSILIAIAAGAAVYFACDASGVGRGTTIFFGIVGLIAGQYLTAFLVRKRVKKVQDELQDMMQKEQRKINRKVQQFQSKPGGNIKLIQRQLEKDQKVMLEKALDFTGNMEPFRKWSPFMGRQIATMRLQFLYQLKEFEQVDALLASHGLLKGPLLMEPILVAMKMARQYKKKDIAGVEKSFKKHVKWFRGSRATLLYGLMAWVWVKEGETEKARELLLKGKEATGNEALAANWTKLSNNNLKNYSNAGLGEEWFSLYLENPPQPKQKMMREKGAKRRMY